MAQADEPQGHVKESVRNVVRDTTSEVVYRIVKMSTKRAVKELRDKLREESIRKLETKLKDISEQRFEKQLNKSIKQAAQEMVEDSGGRADFIRGIEQGFEKGFKKNLLSLAKGLTPFKAIAMTGICFLIVGGGVFAWLNLPQTLSVSIIPSGSGSVTPSSGDFYFGTPVTVRASPAEGWRFDHWDGDASGRSPTATIYMVSDKTATANFSEIPMTYYTLTMAKNGNGSTSPPLGSRNYPEGTEVDIAAIPDSGWQFDNWTGAAAKPNSTRTTVTMDFHKTVTANFSRNYSMQTQFIVASSSFRSIGDLNGCKIRVKGLDKTWQYAETALSTYDITCTPVWMAESEIQEAMDRGIIDAVLVTSPNPWPTLENMIDSIYYKLNLLAWNDKAIQAVTDKFPEMEAASLPAGTYTWQEYDLPGYAPR